jgi:hypothetical protein
MQGMHEGRAVQGHAYHGKGGTQTCQQQPMNGLSLLLSDGVPLSDEVGTQHDEDNRMNAVLNVQRRRLLPHSRWAGTLSGRERKGKGKVGCDTKQ